MNEQNNYRQDGVEQYEVDDELAAAKDEPGFNIADVGLDFMAEPDENGSIFLAPDAEEPLDEAEVSCSQEPDQCYYSVLLTCHPCSILNIPFSEDFGRII